MFRHSRDTEPYPEAVNVAQALRPIPVFAWGQVAMGHLGVPVVLGELDFVVRDSDILSTRRKLEEAGYIPSKVDRNTPPEVLESHPDPAAVIRKTHAGWARRDKAAVVFDKPNKSSQWDIPIVLLTNSFAHLPFRYVTFNDDGTILSLNDHYHEYKNLYHPLESCLLEGLVAAAIDEEKVKLSSLWGGTLKAWISMMGLYLEVDNDALDDCPDPSLLEWYSERYGQIREEKHGPWDRRIRKDLVLGRKCPWMLDEIL